jgi:hypothetical protein
LPQRVADFLQQLVAAYMGYLGGKSAQHTRKEQKENIP